MDIEKGRQVNIGPVVTEWYKPNKEERSFRANFQLGRAVLAFYGPEAVKAARALKEGQSFTRSQAEEFDKGFLAASKKIYELPADTDPREFYIAQNKGAVGAVQYFGRLVPDLSTALALKDEITRLSDRPSDLLVMLCSQPMETASMTTDELMNLDPDGPKRIDKRLAFETRRHAVIHFHLGGINARTLNGRIRTVLSDVQDLLDERLFIGPKGYGKDITSNSYHDDETNEVVGFPDRNDRRPLTAHLKRMTLSVRTMRGIGTVYTNNRKKDDGTALWKSLVKAGKNGGVIHINAAVQDSMGMTFVAMEDSVAPKELANIVARTLREGIDSRIESDHYRQLPRVVAIEEDDMADGDRGQASTLAFNARRKIWLDGIPTPLELMFYDRTTYLDSKYEVGQRDPETGLYLGRAHDLFELRRAKEGVRLVFPESVYPKLSDQLLSRAFIDTAKQTAFRLRGAYRAS